MALATNLVSYWKLNGNSNDSASTNDGTDTSISYSTSYGKLSEGASFNGTTSKITTGASFATGASSKSFSVWFYPTLNNDRGWIVSGGTDNNGEAFGLSLFGANDLWFHGNGGSYDMSIQTISLNTWYHIVVTYDGTTVRSYVNGVAGASASRTLNTTGTGIWFGGRKNGDADGWFQGYADEIGVWSKTLTADEASQLYNSGRANAYPLTDTPSLYGGVAYYKLDESSGDAIDTVGGVTLTNTNTVGYASALINNGADFGTANTNKRFVQSTNDYGTDGGAITISMWVKMRTEIASGDAGFVIHGGATSHVNDMIGYEYNGGTRRLAWNRQQQNTANNVYYYNATLGTSTWHHLVYTYDGTTMKGYYDGTEVVSQALSGNGASGTGDGFSLASTNRGSGTEWIAGFASAYIDEVGVWTRAITGAEVTSLYNSGAGLAYPFTVSTYTGAGFMALKRR